MIELTLGEVADDRRRPAARRRPGDRRHRQRRVRLARGHARRAVPRARRRARRRARLRRARPSRAGAVASLVTRPVDGAGDRGRRRLAALAALAARGAAPAARRHRRRRHRLVGQDVDQGPARAAARPARADGRPARLVQQRARPPVHGAAGRRRDTRFLVLETSARGIGHIRYLTEIAPPRIGVVLNVGSAHLGEFGSPRGDRAGQGRAGRGAAAPTGVAVLNADDPLVRGDGRAHRGPGRHLRASRRTPTSARADVALDELGPAALPAGHAGTARPTSRCGSSARTTSATRWPRRPSRSSAACRSADVAGALGAAPRRSAAGGWRSPSAPTASS